MTEAQPQTQTQQTDKPEPTSKSSVLQADAAIRRQIPKLFDVSDNIRDLVDNYIDEETGEVNEVDLIEVLMKQEDFEETALNIGLLIKELDGEGDKVKAAGAELAKRQKFFHNRAERLKFSLRDAMEHHGYSAEAPKKEHRKIVGTLVTLTMAKGIEVVDVVKEEEIPEDYVRIKTEINKTDIKKDLKAGVEIPGAELKRNPQSLRIKMDTT